MKLNKTAIASGILAFVAIYAIGGIIIIMVLSLLSEQLAADSLIAALRIGGYLALGFPAYVAARAAGHDSFMHAFIMGIIEAIALVLLMTFTFSFEGTLHQYVLSRMLPVFGAVLALCMFAGVLAEWMQRRGQNLEKD
jgi:hypothetical protein